MAIVTKDQLTAPGRFELGTDLVDVDGGQVRVRGLTRRESYEINRISGNEERELHIVAAGLVEPAMTVEEVTAWAEQGLAGELQDVSVRIAQLSRLVPESAKAATKSVSRRRRDQV